MAIYKTDEESVAVVLQSCSVWKITAFFAVSCVVCEGLKSVALWSGSLRLMR